MHARSSLFLDHCIVLSGAHFYRRRVKLQKNGARTSAARIGVGNGTLWGGGLHTIPWALARFAVRFSPEKTAPNTLFCQSSHTCQYRKVFERTFRSPSPPPQNSEAVLRIAPFRPRRPCPENFAFPTNIPSVSRIALTCLAFSSLPGRDPPQAAAKFLIAPLWLNQPRLHQHNGFVVFRFVRQTLWHQRNENIDGGIGCSR